MWYLSNHKGSFYRTSKSPCKVLYEKMVHTELGAIINLPCAISPESLSKSVLGPFGHSGSFTRHLVITDWGIHSKSVLLRVQYKASFLHQISRWMASLLLCNHQTWCRFQLQSGLLREGESNGSVLRILREKIETWPWISHWQLTQRLIITNWKSHAA